MSAADRALRLIDESMELLELIEKDVGVIASSAAKDQVPSKGSIYSLYTLVVKLRDRLTQLRHEVYNVYSLEPGIDD
ncbi:hypothetical protein [Pyrofollis japonicus]|uniref:hypothetical protein n=1 Tax=Pyrofollis japonicus TaxID=3060460 RepID=UPI00295A8CBF|nr:hypothetical protein [Pyrofollis japonicus]